MVKQSSLFMKTQIAFKCREWKALNKFVGLGQRDLNTPLTFQAYLCWLISRTRLRINHPIVAEAVYFPLEKPNINIILIWKADVAKPTDTYQEAPSADTCTTHKPGKTHRPAKQDTNTMAHEQKGCSTCTNERTQQRAWWNIRYLCFHVSSSLHY